MLFSPKLLRLLMLLCIDQLRIFLIPASIKTSRFPTRCKEPEVSPVYKKGDALLKSNYRPVSILTTTSKIFEKLMDAQFQPFIKNTLSGLISSFRLGYSCQHLLLHLVEKWRIYLDSHEVVGALLTDLSKAFDSLPHHLHYMVIELI